MRFGLPKFRKPRLLLSLVVLALVCAFLYPCVSPALEAFSFGQNSMGSTHRTTDTKPGWNLILVNRDSHIPEDYQVELTELSSGEKVDSRIYPALQEMFDAARAEGLQLFVAAGYRTREEQQALMTERSRPMRTRAMSRRRPKGLQNSGWPRWGPASTRSA